MKAFQHIEASSAETVGASNTVLDTVSLQRPTSQMLMVIIVGPLLESSLSAMNLSCSVLGTSNTAHLLSAASQGLTIVNFSAQRKPFLQNRGYVWELLRGCLGGIKEVIGVVTGCVGCILCQKRLRLSSKVDECKPLPPASVAESEDPPLPFAAAESSRCTWACGSPCRSGTS